MPSADVAMPTHNCGPWIDQFMNSLLAQDSRDWRLVARDDCSNDDTVERLEQWQARLGDRMVILPNSGGHNLGIVGNYNAVLGACSAAWVMTADPDDVWLPGKIAWTLQAMGDAERQFGATTPISICTDARVVDAELRPIASSYWQWYRMNPRLAGQLHRTGMESVAQGSTMMVNRALLNLALPIEAASPYQDWWLALVAAAFGQTVALAKPTILYRRHGGNETEEPLIASV